MTEAFSLFLWGMIYQQLAKPHLFPLAPPISAHWMMACHGFAPDYRFGDANEIDIRPYL